MKKQKVLVVDDDELQLTVLRAWLESAGFEVFTRNSSFGTSTIVKREQPDFVVLDLEMPGLDGEALASLLASLAGAEKMGIVFYSGSAALNTRKRSWDQAVLGGIRKTGDSASFLSSFRELITRQKR